MKNIFIISKCGLPHDIGCEIIEEISKKLGYKTTISEKKSQTLGQELLNDIHRDIKKSNIVFVDFTPENFNLAFEAGLSYSLNNYNNLINNENKPGICFLLPQYIYDLNLISSDIKGLKLSFYKNYQVYARNVFNYIKDYFQDDISNINLKKREINDYINSIRIKNVEDFLDFNSLFEKFKLNNSQIGLTKEGIRISRAHFPIYFKNFGFFSQYELKILVRIDKGAFGIAIHIENDAEDTDKNITSLTIPIRCIMFNISQKHGLRPHIFDRNILNRRYHYWPISKLEKEIQNLEIGKFFELIIKVSESHVSIFIENKEYSYNIKELDCSDLDCSECTNENYKKDKGKFIDYIQKEVLDKLNMGTFGFRVHPHELATIKKMELNIY